MNVLLVSQCSKQALPETRRVLDQFAERKGDRVWQTAVTQQGLDTLRKMLRKTARRNTAVACHWIRGKDRTELLWFVGNLRRFNEQGTVPTNTTGNDILRNADENQWHTAEAVALLGAITGLFHDFGKANKLFQKKLKPSAKPPYSEPYRHEWVSLRLFQAFVGEDTDAQWLERLSVVTVASEAVMLSAIVKDSSNPNQSPNPFYQLPPLARAISWLIISHHRLPKLRNDEHEPRIESIDTWLTDRKTFKPYWNSPQCEFTEWTEAQWDDVWDLSLGTPMCSTIWCQKACAIAKRAIKLPSFLDNDWLADSFSSHMARLIVMLADHSYSAAGPTRVWQDKKYKACANTALNEKTQKRETKQKLDEHNIGVSHNAYLLGKSLPKLRQTLPAITRHKKFKQRNTLPRYRWQDKAYELACSVNTRSKTQGFFGINMASTGCGKTFANARIMYGLADEKIGCRFSVALGLRTLTLQTGDALRERLHLGTDDLAVLIGSSAVRDLHERARAKASSKNKTEGAGSGSESDESLFEDHQYVRYDGSLDDGRLSTWLANSPKLLQLLSAPVLVCTIDHLMPATDGDRGGKQIAPMLRLLTSDLVLDEPDDFGLEDLPALTRLVNWAGMLGSRVLLSSATLPPALIKALFEAYRSGRDVYNRVCGESDYARGVCCAWFDEYRCESADLAEADQFAKVHSSFADKRIEKLKQAPVLRRAELLPITAAPNDEAVISAMAATITGGITRLHKQHNEVDPVTGKSVSIGLVRMANINPMVAVAQAIVGADLTKNFRIHFVVYHSQYPMIMRSAIEGLLDQALTRHNSEDIWRVPHIRTALDTHTEKNQIFVVFATAVAEVGRDHDYDWAIAEPSSMRSLIQLAGRIQRHRHIAPTAPNLLILSKNFKALQKRAPAYAKPGFESSNYSLQSHDLTEILPVHHYEHINSIPRIAESKSLDASNSLVDLEHLHMRGKLFGDPDRFMSVHAALWWQHNATWCAELQRLMPFRSSRPDEEFMLLMEDDDSDAIFHLTHRKNDPTLAEDRFNLQTIECSAGFTSWINLSTENLLEVEAERAGLGYKITSHRFGRFRLPEQKDGGLKKWQFSEIFGVWQEQ